MVVNGPTCLRMDGNLSERLVGQTHLWQRMNISLLIGFISRLNNASSPSGLMTQIDPPTCRIMCPTVVWLLAVVTDAVKQDCA